MSTIARQSGPLTLGHAREIETGRRLGVIAHGLLREHVVRGFQAVGLQGGETQPPLAGGKRHALGARVVVVLPLHAETGCGEIVARLGQRNVAAGRGDARLGPHPHRLADAVHVDVDPDDRPTVFPVRRLQMHHAADGLHKLEVEKPPLPVGRVDQRPLVRAVDGGAPLLHHHFFLIGTIDVAGAEHRLPAHLHPAFGYADVVIAVALVYLRALGHGAGIYGNPVVEQFTPVGAHLVQDNGACPVSAAAEIGLPVLVPEGARVFPLLDGHDPVQRCPRPVRVGGRAHEEPFVRGAEEDPELTVVVTYGRCPGTAGKTAVVVPLGIVEAVIDLGDDGPVDHVVRR